MAANLFFLCKIADLVSDSDNDEVCDVYEKKLWKMNHKDYDIEEIKNTLNTFKNSGFRLTEKTNALYLTYSGANQRSAQQSTFFVQSKIFPLIFDNYVLKDDLVVDVNITQGAIIKKNIIATFFNALFQAHKELSNDTIEERLNLPDNFLPKLCRFQERSVKWLLKQEISPARVRHIFKRYKFKDGSRFVYKNLLETEFTHEEPQNIKLAPGGILADEMGLGKTVEFLALILLNKRNIPNSVFLGLDEDDIPLVKKPRKDSNIICICNTRKKELLECKMCHSFQHRRCVTKYDLEHSKDVNEPYICSSCWQVYSKNNLIKSNATLIVTPNTIRTQWLNEINRHIVPKLHVHVYDGISKDWISPRQLSDYDIVLTDYNVMRREVYHTSSQDSDRNMRHKRLSLRVYSPLLMIEWWRVALDEAQMVESNVSQLAALVRTLPAINRWAITGTPIQRSIDDLYPLVRFIGLENYLSTTAWNTLVKNFMIHCDKASNENNISFQPCALKLIEILQNFMWRTEKQQVLNELPIPPQTEQVHHLTLKHIERFYYLEQHEKCKSAFFEILDKYTKSSELVVHTSHQIMKIIMKPLLMIRQCCSIPTIKGLNGQQNATGLIQKQFLQPKELHAHLLMRTEKECKGHLRNLASSYNGCAAIYFIKGNYSEAVKNYESVLKLAKEYSEEKNISVDSLLQIHALHNILDARNISPVLAKQINKEIFEEYEAQLNALEWKYLETYASQLCRVNQAFVKAKEILETNLKDLEMSLLDLLGLMLDFNDENTETQLLAKILQECLHKFGNMRLEPVSSLRGALYLITTWYDKLTKKQNEIIEAFKKLEFYTSNIKPRNQVSVQTWRDISGFVNTVCDCHLIELRQQENNEVDSEENEFTAKDLNRSRQIRNGKNLCALCKLLDIFNNYECLLFKKSIDLTTNAVEGNENPQLEVEMIKIILNFLKSKQPKMTTEIEKHSSTLVSMQNFCKKAIKFWIEIEFTVKAYDELDMCKMRTTLTDDPDDRSNYKITLPEVDITLLRQEQNLKYAQNCFNLKLARLKYIKHLEGDLDIGPCPICHSDNEGRYTFLVCGHQMCWGCFKYLTRLNHGNKITCSICRNEQNVQSVFFLSSSNKNSVDQSVPICGDFSSKITYIVQLVKKLKSEHNNCDNANESMEITSNLNYPLKILIFSQWSFTLDALANAFSQNGITFIQHQNVRTVEMFKNMDLGITCLLMLLSKGCKGLNLIEATHVFLVEPGLNPSEELQAIGRVHRFGQTRPTTVHRFIVDQTIEENIYNVVSAGRENSQNYEFDNMTFENLRELFKLDDD